MDYIEVTNKIETPKISADSVKIELANKDEDAITATKRQYEERVNLIQEKYDSVLEKVNKINEKINEDLKKVDQAIKNGQTYALDRLNAEIAELQEEADTMLSIARAWLDKQLLKATAWLNKQTQRVTDSINSLASKTLDATNEFIEKQIQKKAEAKLKALQ